jgi:Amidase
MRRSRPASVRASVRGKSRGNRLPHCERCNKRGHDGVHRAGKGSAANFGVAGTGRADALAVAQAQGCRCRHHRQDHGPRSSVSRDTRSVVHGATRNPWHLARTPGGSSGGAVTSVADGVTGMGSATSTLAHVGPIARNLDDAALLLAVCAGPDTRAAMPPIGSRLRGLRYLASASPFTDAGLLAGECSSHRVRWRSASSLPSSRTMELVEDVCHRRWRDSRCRGTHGRGRLDRSRDADAC